jgi:hypothetical protein
MLQAKKKELRRVLMRQFDRGINKPDLLAAVEKFIDNHYEIPVNTYRSVLHDLTVDILGAGGYEAWREGLVSEQITSETQRIKSLLIGGGQPEQEIHASKKDSPSRSREFP